MTREYRVSVKAAAPWVGGTTVTHHTARSREHAIRQARYYLGRPSAPVVRVEVLADGAWIEVAS